jgi:hypothetical protein
MRYVLIDTANMFFRARHVAFRAGDAWEKVGCQVKSLNKVSNCRLMKSRVC